MFKFLLLLLLFIIIFPILRFIIAIWGASRRFKKQYKDFASSGNTHSDGEYNHRTSFRKRKKIFSKEDGDYVEFEEIKVEESSFTSSSETTEETYDEPQISDAKFEEIKK